MLVHRHELGGPHQKKDRKWSASACPTAAWPLITESPSRSQPMRLDRRCPFAAWWKNFVLASSAANYSCRDRYRQPILTMRFASATSSRHFFRSHASTVVIGRESSMSSRAWIQARLSSQALVLLARICRLWEIRCWRRHASFWGTCSEAEPKTI